MRYFSIMWDDGLATDLKVMEIARKYNLTSNFALSFARHSNVRIANDARGDYGELVSLSELRHFSDFEISNHTANHTELTSVSIEAAQAEIDEGQKGLQDFFGREIRGFCYPYGQYNSSIVALLKDRNYLYARTTKRSDNFNPLMLNPTCKWHESSEDQFVVLWGHSYEIENWQKLDELYRNLSQDDQIKVIAFDDMVRRKHESNSRVRIL